jgi:hypothetical protein
MGYYEQIGSDNRRYREERARHPLRYKLIDTCFNGFVIIASLLIWTFLLSPLWIWLVL